MLKVRMIEGFSAFTDPWDVKAVIPVMADGRPVLGQSIIFFANVPKMIVIGTPEDIDASVDAARRDAFSVPPMVKIPGSTRDG